LKSKTGKKDNNSLFLMKSDKGWTEPDYAGVGMFVGYEKLSIPQYYGSQAHPFIAPEGIEI
jgi:hypothetical protein